MTSNDLISGETEIVVPAGTIVDRAKGKLVLGVTNGLPKLNNKRDHGKRRKLAVVEGKRTVLVVRVIASSKETTKSMEELADSVFGSASGFADADDPVNLRSQYMACSYGKLEFNPA
eukprot:4094766-Ditylum_brightwellii.AAC.1